MSETLLAILSAVLDMYLDAAPWLIVGIVAAGLVHALMPDGLLGRWLGGNGAWSVIKAALVGAPLPLCSCGVLPAAVGLRKDGASKGATVSFLIATPETGPDSVAISYALLGPIMALSRPIAAIFSAIFSGLLTNAFVSGEGVTAPVEAEAAACTTCCSDSCSSEVPPQHGQWVVRGWGGRRYGFTNIYADPGRWLGLGSVVEGGSGAPAEPQGMGG